MSAVKSGETPVERSEWPVTGFPSHLYHQTVGKTDGRTPAILDDRRTDGVGILQRQLVVIQEHLDRRRNGLWTAIVNGAQHPGRFHERQVRHPRSAGDKRFSRRELPCIVSGDEPDQHVGVNGPHVVS